ncbi:synaptotagmin-16 isoform X5 [Daphnia magna]|uniref:synaptotagmin-16 isoform X5 n=1 Tax=Daphnia magna TaxID=35525 RepID=UPI001E1BD317|nr:synaptotagmin-16 isoform X5 [Daphnia magna]
MYSTIENSTTTTTTPIPVGFWMETEPWWPGLVVAVVSSLILLLFLVTLLVHHLPPLQKWLLPVLTRIAPPNKPAIPPQTTSAGHIQSDNGSPQQPHPALHPRSRPSRPSSLPCLPEEKLVYCPSSSSVVAVAAAAAAQAAQAAAMPHRPHSFYPPDEEDEPGEEDDDDCTTPQQQPPLYPPQQRGRVHHKLNLALHSDGSEASNSSSSASAVNDYPDHLPASLGAGSHHHHSQQHHSNEQQRRHHRSSDEAVLRQRAANRQDLAHQQHRHQRLVDHDDIQRLDEWTPPTQRQSSLAETDCDESMIDMTDMSSTFGESESVTGSVILPGPNRTANKAVAEMGFSYNSASGKLVVRLVELRQLTSASRNTSIQLRLLLLPDRKQRCKSKLRYMNQDGSTVSLMETFVFNRIEPGELNSTGIRLRLYCSERLRRERLLGEAFVGLASMTLDHQREQSLLVALETKSGPFKKSLAALGRSTSSSSSRGDISPTSIGPSEQWPPEMIPPRNGIPELLLGLAYNGTTGRLSVEILRAASLRSWTSNRVPDACVKVMLLTQTGQELGRAKTVPKKNSEGGPTWMETFAFQVTLFQLAEVTLLISVVNKRSLKRRELLGWISLGFDSSVDQQTEHWQEMREAAGEQICHWHALLPP